MIDGVFVPAGVEVSVASWVVNRNPEYFSSSPGEFRPERWIVGYGDGDDEDGVKKGR